MVHRIVWRVGSADALDFWAERLGAEGVVAERDGDAGDPRLRFRDPEGLEHELRVNTSGDEPLIAEHPEVPAEHALQGFDGVRAYASDPEASRALLEEALGFQSRDDGWEVRGERRGGLYAYDPPPERPVGLQGAGSVHHIAFASEMDDHETWRERAIAAGAHPTPVIDRFWFRSIYFREPSGVLFEIATMGPGFGADEDMEHLGETLSLPPRFEPMREEIEQKLTPVPDIRRWRPGAVPRQ
jgi:glyoxalase family protein